MTHILLLILLAAPGRKREIVVPPHPRHLPHRVQAPAQQEPTAPALQATPPRPPAEASRDPIAAGGSGQEPLILDTQLGMRALHRQLSTVDDLFGRFYPHTQPIAAALALQVRYFPGAHAKSSVVSGLGIYAHGSWAPALSSRLPDTTRVAVTSYDFGAGIVFRYVLGPVELTAELGGLMQSWLFSPAPAGTLPLTYLAIRPAIDARFNVSTHFAALVGGELRVPLRSPAEQFPRATGLGFRLLAGAALPVIGGLEIRITGEYLRYGLDMHSQPGDSAVLGGLIDQSYGGTLAVAYRL